jgi:8-oxo-dGTP pyrophosphatase MutT (NUDIX family)
VSIAARPAASVVLLRDGAASSLEVWLMRRTRGMAFAAGMTFFPGGRVDPDDGGDARMAAARELFEETGVLLASPPVDASGLRLAVESRELSFAELLVRLGVTADLDALAPWARWITPESEPRRYDTHFFLAALPAGAVASADTPEADAGGWSGVRAALDDERMGHRLLLPPTAVMLHDLAGFSSVAEALAAAAARRIEAVLPVIEDGPGGQVARLPDGSTWRMPR